MKIQSVGIFDELPKLVKITMLYTTIMQKLLSGEWCIKPGSLVKPGMTKNSARGDGKHTTVKGRKVRDQRRRGTYSQGRRKRRQEHVIPEKAGTRHSCESRNPEGAIVHNKQPCVYILASQKNGTLYTGVTSNLIQRIYQHKHDLIEGFTKKYGIHVLVYYELHCTMEESIIREKQIKKWKRQWKIELIEKNNQEWRDLYDELV